MLVYLASPLGFSELGRLVLYHQLLPRISTEGITILDPWRDLRGRDSDFLGHAARRMTRETALEPGFRNLNLIESCHLLVAVLDGSDVDGGVAAEVGFGAGIGKKVIGYRGDFRPASETPATVVNPQIEALIIRARGVVVTSIAELAMILRTEQQKILTSVTGPPSQM